MLPPPLSLFPSCRNYLYDDDDEERFLIHFVSTRDGFCYNDFARM
jgi:hypothetical protein